MSAQPLVEAETLPLPGVDVDTAVQEAEASEEEELLPGTESESERGIERESRKREDEERERRGKERGKENKRAKMDHSKPPWLDEFAESVSSRTFQKFEPKLQALENNQVQLKDEVQKVNTSLVAVQKSNVEMGERMDGQDKKIEDMRKEVEAYKKAVAQITANNLASSSTRSTSSNVSEIGSTNTAARGRYDPNSSDPELIVAGKYVKAVSKNFQAKDVKKNLEAFNNSEGKSLEMFEHRCVEGRSQVFSFKLKDVSEVDTPLTPKESAWEFTKWYKKSTNRIATASGISLWMLIDKPKKERDEGSVISRALHLLHLAKEDKGLGDVFLEYGEPAKLVEGKFKGSDKGVFWHGRKVGNFVSGIDGNSIVWDYSELAAEPQPVTKELIDRLERDNPPKPRS